MKEIITKILLKQFSSVYCGTCEAQEDWCDECHRKMMNWGLSEKAAGEIADEIIKEMQ